jgi:hypothetical protein
MRRSVIAEVSKWKWRSLFQVLILFLSPWRPLFSWAGRMWGPTTPTGGPKLTSEADQSTAGGLAPPPCQPCLNRNYSGLWLA